MSENGVSMSITIEQEELQELLKKLYKRGTNLSPVLKSISQMMRSFALENFEQEGRPHKWAQHSPVTELLLAKAKKKKPFKLLQQSGGLKKSIIAFNTGTEAGIGSNLEYARIHQLGGMAGRNRKVKIKARPYLDQQPDDIEAILATIEDYIYG